MFYFLENKLYFKINKQIVPIDLSFFHLKSENYNLLSTQIINNQEYFFVGGEEFCRDTLTYKFEENIGKFNKKTNQFDLISNQCKVEIKYKFFIKYLYVQKVKDKKKDIIYNIFEVERNKRFNHNGDTYIVKRIRVQALGYISKPPFQLLNFIKAQKEQYLLLDPILCYDVETCVFKDNIHQPYMLAWSFSKNFSFLTSYTENGFLRHDNINVDKSTIGEQFVQLIEDLMRRCEIKSLIIFGYNNHNFDDHFILNEFRAKRYYINKTERNGKVSTLKMYKNDMIIEIKDLIKWLPDVTLKEACLTFNTLVLKGDCQVVIYNDMCNEARNLIYRCNEEVFFKIANAKNFIEKNKLKKSKYFDSTTKTYNVYDYVLDYCINDVNATLSLYFHLNAAFLKIKTYFFDNYNCILPHNNILRYISPAFVTSLLYKQIFNNQKMKRIVFNEFEYIDSITKAYFGGIVNFGCLGEYNSPSIVCQDVKAMYPLCMQNKYPAIYSREDFSIGGEINLPLIQCQIDNIIDARDKAKQEKTLFNYEWVIPLNDIKGIFYCDLIEPKETDKICIAPFPYRYLNADKLIYNYTSKSNVVVCTSDMKSLILCGFKIKLLFHEHNMLFHNNEHIFEMILKPLDSLKVIAKEDSNNAIKKLMKLFMNSLSGKLGQHIVHKIKYSVNSHHMIEADRQNIFSSLHYLACFVTGEARYVLFRTIYNLHADHIYNETLLSARVGIFILCDTDSVMYDSHLASPVNFIQHNEMGHWDYEKNDYIVHWSQKSFGKMTGVFVLGRKSYVPINKKTILSRTLKGIRRDQMELIDYDDLKKVCSDIPKVLHFSALSKEINVDGNFKLLTKTLFETTIKKTLTIAKPDFIVDNITNEYIITNNHDNLNQTIYKENILNFLKFVHN